MPEEPSLGELSRNVERMQRENQLAMTKLESAFTTGVSRIEGRVETQISQLVSQLVSRDRYEAEMAAMRAQVEDLDDSRKNMARVLGASVITFLGTLTLQLINLQQARGR